MAMVPNRLIAGASRRLGLPAIENAALFSTFASTSRHTLDDGLCRARQTSQRAPIPPRSSRRTFTSNASTLAEAAGIKSALSSTSAEAVDIAVIGGGVVGLSLACALGSSPTFRSSKATISLVEAASLARLHTWTKDKQGEAPIRDWENRVIYLTEDNLAWLDAIGVSKHLVGARLCAVHGMHVTDGVTNAALDFDVPSTSSSSGSSGKRLGTMVEISNLQQAMLQRIAELNSQAGTARSIAILEGCKVASIEPAEEMATRSTYQDARPVLSFDDARAPLKARLLVGADGGNSPVRKYASINAQGWEYGRFGVVATMQCANRGTGENTENVAYQRFLPTGTIASLPLSNDAASLVWTLPPDVAKAIVALQKSQEAAAEGQASPLSQLISAAFRLPWSSLRPILNQLAACDVNKSMDWLVPLIDEKTFQAGPACVDEGNVPSPVINIGLKSTTAFPLKLAHAESYLGSSMRRTTIAEAGAAAITPSTLLSGISRTIAALTSPPDTVVAQAGPTTHRGRTVLIGDAAHTIHPLAGQGLNLGLADARSLSKTLEVAVENGADLGSHVALKAYPRERYLANQAMLSAVDHLHWLFVTPPPPGAEQRGQSFTGSLASRAAIWARSTGFEVLNELGPIKQAIMGAAGSTETRRQPRT